MSSGSPGATNGAIPDNIRAEYNALRAEVLYCDQACLIIMGALLSGSLTLLTFITQTLRQPNLLALLSPVWLIGYLYISEKRFVIETAAKYMRDRIERQPGFGWETWLRGELSGRGQFRRVYPYYLETLVSGVAILGLPVLTYWDERWHPSWGVWTSVLFVPLTALVIYRNVLSYARRGQDH
jgi:hypothetical protein